MAVGFHSHILPVGLWHVWLKPLTVSAPLWNAEWTLPLHHQTDPLDSLVCPGALPCWSSLSLWASVKEDNPAQLSSYRLGCHFCCCQRQVSSAAELLEDVQVYLPSLPGRLAGQPSHAGLKLLGQLQWMPSLRYWWLQDKAWRDEPLGISSSSMRSMEISRVGPEAWARWVRGLPGLWELLMNRTEEWCWLLRTSLLAAAWLEITFIQPSSKGRPLQP